MDTAACHHNGTSAKRAARGMMMSSVNAEDEIRHDLFCQECGYNLRGLISNRCPECGHSLEAMRCDTQRLPWVHRAELGRRRAYWRTVWMVMFRHKRFCEEVARPVDYVDAQRFRWVTVLHVYLPILAGTLLIYTVAWPKDEFWDQMLRAVWPVAALHGCILLFLAAATGVPSYYFHPRDIPVEQQNRAIALSYYACAALAWTPLAFVILLAGLVVFQAYEMIGMGLLLLAAFLPFGQLVAWMADLIHVGVRVMPQRRGRLALLAGTLPFLWLALGAFVFLGVPLLALFLVLFLSSLF